MLREELDENLSNWCHLKLRNSWDGQFCTSYARDFRRPKVTQPVPASADGRIRTDDFFLGEETFYP